MSISSKIISPVIAMALLFAAGFGYFWVDIVRVDSQLTQGATAVETINRLATRLDELAELQQTRLLSYRFSQSESYLSALRQSGEEIRYLLRELERRLVSPRAQRVVESYRSNREGLDRLQEDLIAAIRSGDETAIARAFQRWQLKSRTLDAVRADLLSYAREYPERTLATIAQSRERFAAVITGLGAAVAAMVALSLFYYRRLISRPLKRLTEAAERIAHGELDSPLNIRSRDEIGRLASAFGHMTRSLISTNRALEREVAEKSAELSERRRISRRLRSINDELRSTKAGLEREIRERQESQRQLFEEKERAQVTLLSIGDGVITTGIDGHIENLNPVAEELTGWTRDEALGKPLETVFRIVDETSGETVANPARACLGTETVMSLSQDSVLLSRDGSRRYISDSAAPIRGRDGRVLGAILVFHDVSESRELARKIAHQAKHDALTGLINRHEFEQRLGRALMQAQTGGVEHTLLYMDLDQFKIVNDTCGHMAGDELLRQITAYVSEHLRGRDTFARLGGDEFGVLLEGCSPDQAVQIANELRRAVESFRFTWQQRTFSLGVSVGLVPINRHSESLAQVLSLADTACYAAKEAGRNRVYVADERGLELRQRQSQLEWVARIKQALAEDRMQLRYQTIAPIVANGEGSHYEVLLYMDNGNGETSPPGSFIPAAERYNLMPSIDRWVVRRVLSWLAANPAHLGGLELCSINLSGHSLGSEDFRDFVIQQFRRYRTPPEKICFEITETVAVTNLARTIQFINTFKRLGCRFSLDDFGSGFSSYTYLKNLPVDFLKIDGTFVRAMAEDAMDFAMVESINRIGHVLGKQTIAEFVEDQAALDKARELGIDYVQGYGIATPRPLEELAVPYRVGQA